MGLKILFLSHFFYPDIGGIETNSEILANAFSEEGHDVHLLTWSAAKEDSKMFPFEVIRNPDRKQLFTEHKWADVVFENNPCLRLSWPNLFVRRPFVVALNTWISTVSGKIGFQERLKFLWLKRAKKVIAVSDAVRKRCWLPAVVIGNPYREKEFKIISGIKRTDNFVFLGRLVSDKGAEMAIYAIHKLASSAVSRPSLTIIGSGPDLEKLKELTRKLALQNQIYFAGSLRGSELVHCLNLFRFMLVPSVWEEPFGNVAIEGMACGCLPIVSNGGGLPDAVGDAGLTFERGNVEALVKQIEEILNNPDLEIKLRSAAANHLKTHESKYVSDRYLEVIKQAVGRKLK